MIRRHEDVVPINPYPPCPCPVPPTPIIPVVSVSSVNGMVGDVKLKDIIIYGIHGEVTAYNGTEETPITAEDLGLETVLNLRGIVPYSYIASLTDRIVGDLYECQDDGLLYLWLGKWVILRPASNDDILKISIDGKDLPVNNNRVEIQKATAEDYGVTKFGKGPSTTTEEVAITLGHNEGPHDGCMVLNFNNIMQGSISVDKLKGDLWLKADTSVKKPDESVD